MEEKQLQPKQRKAACAVALLGAILMIVSLFLPYGSAKEEQAKRFERYPDVIIYEEANMTAKDMIDVSMVEYAKVYAIMGEELWGTAFAGYFYAGLVAVIGVLSLITLLLASKQKPIGSGVFAILSAVVFHMQNWDYSDRGVIPGSTYEWGIAYYLFYAAAAMVLVGAVWMKVENRKRKKRAGD